MQVNQQWAGHPGRTVKQITKQLPIQYPLAVDCTSTPDQEGWVLGPVVAAQNNTRFIKSKSANLCVDSKSVGRVATLRFLAIPIAAC